MSLPKAIASGPSADTPDAVRPVRVAIGAGVLAALYLLVLYLAQPVPTRVLALFGGAKNDVERHGGLEMIWFPPPGMSDQEVVARFHVGEHAAQLRKGTDAFVIGVPNVRPTDVEQTAKRLGGEAGLEFHRVLRVHEMESLIRLLELPMRDAKPVDAEVDQWRPDEGGETRTDYYLHGTSVDAINAKIREAFDKGWQLPAGTRFAIERDETEKGVWFRTYVIDERVELDGGDIDNAMGSYDPNSNRPIVLLDFTREGAEKFAKLTSEIVGEKLATMMGDQVFSAPQINQPIRGGRASITMGGSDVAKQERDRDMLVNTLKAGALPAGGKILTARYVAPVHDQAAQWLARGAIALGIGALIALLVWIVVRVTRPVRRRPPTRTGGGLPWRRVAVTLLAPVAIYVVTSIVVLGINRGELDFVISHTDSWFSTHLSLEYVSFGAFGIMPIINAYIFVEVLALIVPGWRRRRHAGPDARAPIGAAVVITAATLLFIQGWFFAQYLYGLNRGGADVMPEGLAPQLLVVASVSIGTLVLAGVAALIREHGVGNGWAVLLASGLVTKILDYWLDRSGRLDADTIVGGMTILAIAIAVITVARWRIARVGEAPLRLPTSGAVPLSEVGGLFILLSVLTQLSLGDATLRLYDWGVAARQHHLVLVGLMAALTVLWSFAFARPNVTRKLAERVGVVAPATSAWWSATMLSAALLVLVGATSMTTEIVRPSSAWLTNAGMATVLAVLALDIYDDMRARRVTLDRVWTLHQAQYIDLVSRALDDAGIPHHMTSANLKTLLAFFGPFAGVDVLVPPEHVPAARTRIRELFA